MESNGDFDQRDYVEVFGQLPKKELISDGTRHLLYLIGTALMICFIVLFLMFLGLVAFFTNPCIKDHTVDIAGKHLSLPHERNEEGCIRDFNHPTGYGK